MDTKGDFQFGVPQAAFNKVNAVYDSEVTPRLKEGVFLDRQTFLMSLVDDSDEISPELVADGKPQLAEGRVVELVERGRRFRYNRWEPERSFVLSTPLKRADGAALGSLYLKRSPVRDSYYRRDEPLEVVFSVSAGLMAASIAVLWVLLPTWVYVDARERGVRRAPLFAFLTVISSLVGLVVYLIARPEDSEAAHLPGLRARGERRGLLPALRARPVVGDLLRLPLSAEAGLGLLPGVPQRDQAAGRRYAPCPRRASASFPNRCRGPERSRSQEVACRQLRVWRRRSARPAARRPGSSSRAVCCRSCPGTRRSRAWRSIWRPGSRSSRRSASSRRSCWSRGWWA